MAKDASTTVWHRIRAGAPEVAFAGGIVTICVIVLRKVGVLNDTGDNWPLIMCAFLLFVVSRIDRVSLLALGPLKVELRQQIEEAAATSGSYAASRPR